MQRRSFLKRAASAGFLTFITPKNIIHAFAPTKVAGLEEGFLTPPASAKPYTWWHWMNGNITKAGITLDLEAMKEAGLGGFQLFDAGTGITKGPVEYLSPTWLNLMEHAIQESERLNLEFAMHNCPGWSSSGGPWITPEMSMQQLTWSEIYIKGGKTRIVQLPPPPRHLNYYQDAKTIAFPALPGEEKALQELVKKVTTNATEFPVAAIAGPSPTGILIQPAPGSKSAYLQLEFHQPYSLTGLTLFTALTGSGGKFTLETSMNGLNFQEAGTLAGGSNNLVGEGSMPATTSFPAREARFIRLVSAASRHIYTIWPTSATRLTGWLAKGNFRNTGGRAAGEVEPDGEKNNIDPQSVMDLTALVDETGLLTWKAPKGQWTILRIGHTSIGKLNHSAPTTGTGLECDKYSREAFKFHFDHMFQKLLPSLQPVARKGKVGLLIDSYEMGQQNWTRQMPAEFLKRRQYNLTAYLPALTGRVVGTVEDSNRFLWDFRRTCADMMADNYHGEFDRLCQQHGIQSYTEPYGGGPMEEMQVGARVQNNMGEFWAGHTVLWENSGMVRTIKLAASIAHANNQKIVGAEAFTAEPGGGKWQQYPYAMKALGDWMYTQGLTRFIFHRFAHQPHPTAKPGMTMGPWGIHFDRTNTWWHQAKAWLQYSARTQYLLQQGTLVADFAYLTSDEPGISIPTMAHQLNPRPPYGFDYDLIAPESLLKAQVHAGNLVFPGGRQYKLLILPEKETMLLSTLRQLSLLVQAGMVLVGQKPLRSPSLAPEEQEKTLFADLVSKTWGNADGTRQKENRLGQGRVFVNLSLEEIAETLSLKPDFSFTSESNDAPINFIHRRQDNTDIYFIANRRRTQEKLVCTFRVQQKRPEFWDPDTGKVFEYPLFEVGLDEVKVALDLPPAGSAFILFQKPVMHKGLQEINLNNKTNISTHAFAKRRTRLYPNMSQTFGLGLWVKPETDIPLTAEEFFGSVKSGHFVIYPPSGMALYGPGHATLGLTAGRNGLVLFERETEELVAVLAVPAALAGWTHVGLSYQDGIPRVYLNGKLMQSGQASGKVIHPGLGEAFQEDGASYYNGDMSTPLVQNTAVHPATLKKWLSTRPPVPSPAKAIAIFPQHNTLLFNQNGTYTLTGAGITPQSVHVTGAGELMALNQNWIVAFPPDLGAPKGIVLPKLTSLHTHPEAGVRYFSGTAAYQKKFKWPAGSRKPNLRLFLDLGKVEVLAEVILNGKNLGIVWKPPYRLDVTDALQTGENQLEIKITNLWPNRLIGDEQLPVENEYESVDWPGKWRLLGAGAIKQLPDWYQSGKPKPPGGRITFTTWKHYHQDSPLLESGLIGPVILAAAEVWRISG